MDHDQGTRKTGAFFFIPGCSSTGGLLLSYGGTDKHIFSCEVHPEQARVGQAIGHRVGKD